MAPLLPHPTFVPSSPLLQTRRRPLAKTCFPRNGVVLLSARSPADERNPTPVPQLVNLTATARTLCSRVVNAARFTVLSGALLFASPATSSLTQFSSAKALQTRSSNAPALAAAVTTPSPSSRPSRTSSPPSDVEAAAMTLGVVTVGGLLMRFIVSARRDDAAEQKRVEAECARLAEEERMRALRKERRRLEGGAGLPPSESGLSTDSASASTDDDTLMSALRQRVQSLDDPTNVESDDQQPPSQPSVDKSSDKNVTGAAPSGLGSAVLERPDNDSSANEDPGFSEDDHPTNSTKKEEKLASTDEQDMLKRMWNLSPPDKE